MWEFLQAIVSAVWSRLRSASGREPAPRLGERLAGDRDGETSQSEDRERPHTDHAQGSDDGQATASLREREPPVATVVVASECEEVAASRDASLQPELESPPATPLTKRTPREDNEGIADDEVPPNSHDTDTEPPLPPQDTTSSEVPASRGVLPTTPRDSRAPIGALPSSQLGKASPSGASSPTSATESPNTPPSAGVPEDDAGHGRERADAESDARHDILSSPRAVDGEGALGEGTGLCPTAPPHEAIDREDEEATESTGQLTPTETSEPVEVDGTDEPNNLTAEARDGIRGFAGESDAVSDGRAVNPFATENAGTDDDSDREGQRLADGVKPEAHGPLAIPPISPPASERRAPSQYRPPTGAPPARRKSPQPRVPVENAHGKATPGQSAAIEVRVRVLFRHAGYCIVSLLPKRLPGLPEELVARSPAGDVELRALQEDWYQDVVPDHLADLLRAGFVWVDPNATHEWRLSGREVFVLARGTIHRGFVSCARLTLGRDHVVLCTTGRLRAVGDALRAAGCTGWTELADDDGAPPGWLVLREIRPQRPVPLSSDADIMNVLRPLPDIEIALEGGIRIAYNTWLLGYPPAIRIYGYGGPECTESVLIDGQEAADSERGGYTTPGWDAAGDHQVSCASTSRSYSVVRSQSNWPYWSAHSLSIPGARGEPRDFEFCGPLVRPVTANPQLPQRRVIQVSPTNPVLLGARPGEVFFAHRRNEVWGAQCLELPPFDPLWALPAQPLLCDKRTNRIVLVGQPAAEVDDVSWPPLTQRANIALWCQFVLDASRKGLAIEPASSTTHNLWREHKRRARTLWRKLR